VLEKAGEYLGTDHSYAKTAEHEGMPIMYDDRIRTEKKQPVGLASSTVWRWLSWLGGMKNTLRAACELIRQKEPNATGRVPGTAYSIHRSFCGVMYGVPGTPPLRYESAEIPAPLPERAARADKPPMAPNVAGQLAYTGILPVLPNHRLEACATRVAPIARLSGGRQAQEAFGRSSGWGRPRSAVVRSIG
jgi:hypothetical protein